MRIIDYLNQQVFLVLIVVMLTACGGSSSSDNTPITPQNNAPVANAGSDQSIELGQTATLSASQSNDPDGDSLTYRWELISQPSTSTLNIDNATNEALSITPDIEGDYVFSLTVNDGTVDSNADEVKVSVNPAPSEENQQPIANAGPDQSLELGQSVTLSASQSSDADGDVLTYRWELLSKPASSNFSLSDVTSETFTVTPDIEGDYVFSLVVNDGTVDSDADQVTVTVIPTTSGENQAPVANAGADQSIELGQSITLSASQSSDADGDALTYRWTLLSKPATSNLNVSDLTSETFTITPDSEGDYVFSLVVNDGIVDSNSDEVLISVKSANQAPVADAGTNQTANVDDAVSLSGADSRDADGDSLSFQWSLIASPKGSQLNLTPDQSNQVEITITPDTNGDYSFQLEVSDGQLTSSPSVVTVSAENNDLDITDRILVKRAGSCNEYLGTFQSNVEDIKRNMGFIGSVSMSENGSVCSVTVNQIPNHDFNDQTASFATNVSEVIDTLNIPIAPQVVGTPAPLELGVTEGVMLNGVTLDMLAAACYGVGNEPLGQEKIGCGPDQNENPWRYDPMSPLNGFGTDQHNAHTQPNGKYHYHANPVAMFNQTCEAGIPSAVIGFAADGYPIFGSCFLDSESGQVRKATSSYVLKNNGGPRQDVAGYDTPVAGTGAIASSNYDGQFRGDWEYMVNSGDLDECNGMVIDGQYGYYVTDSFPWVINCFKGQTNNTFGGAAQEERRSHTHNNGTVHSH